MVTSLISLTYLHLVLIIFKLHICAIKYTIPAAIECGVFSGINYSFESQSNKFTTL